MNNGKLSMSGSKRNLYTKNRKAEKLMGAKTKKEGIMKKRTVSILLATMLAAGVLSGCSSSGETTANSAASEAEAADSAAETMTQEAEAGETTSGGETAETGEYQRFDGVTISTLVGSNQALEGMNAVVELAKEKLGIEVTIETRVEGTEGDNLMKTRLASGDMTDLTMYNSGSLLTALNPAEYFCDLSGEAFVETYDDTYKSTVTVDGKVYGVPFQTTEAGAIMYYKPDYEELGLEVPDTWDEFLANCEALKAAGKTAVIGSWGETWTSQVLFLGDNYNLIANNPDFAEQFTAGTAKFATTKEGVESFQKYLDIRPYYNEDYLSAKYADGVEMMAEGLGTHWIILTGALPNLNANYPEATENIGIFGIPGDNADDHGITVWYPASWYLNKNAENVDACKEFLKLWVSPEGIAAYTSAYMPSGPSCIKGVELGEQVPEAVRVDMQKYFDEGKTLPALEFLTQIKGPNCEQITIEVGSGQTTAEEAAKKYDEDCKKQALQNGINWE